MDERLDGGMHLPIRILHGFKHIPVHHANMQQSKYFTRGMRNFSCLSQLKMPAWYNATQTVLPRMQPLHSLMGC